MRRKKLREFAVANVGSNLMKAVLLDKPGPPSSLRIGEISTPRPGVDEALVRVCATSLNPVDYKVAAQGYEGWNYPHVLGVDIAGVIETLGEGVDSWNLGDRVFYHTTWRKDGSYAEFNVAPAHTFARVPEGIFFVDAATLPCAALTAYCALYRRLHIREGDIVLVHAAAGGVGGFAIQLAKAAKAFVIGTCSEPNTQYVRELGADEVINYRAEDVFQRVKAIAGDRGIDAIVDTIGQQRANNYLKPCFPRICRSSSSQLMLGPSSREPIPSSMACSSSSVHDSSESSSSRSCFFSSLVSFGSSSSILSKLIGLIVSSLGLKRERSSCIVSLCSSSLQPTSLSLCSEMCGSLPNWSRCPASRRGGSLPRKGR